jgi:hypothetical protein
MPLGQDSNEAPILSQTTDVESWLVNGRNKWTAEMGMDSIYRSNGVQSNELG